MTRKGVLTIFLILVAVIAKGYDIYNITNNEGLSNSAVNVIFQDSNGLLWFGTWDGLNMYNGRNFRIYKPDPDNAKSISNNVIWDILEEKQNILWIATERGINRFDMVSDEFERFFDKNGLHAPYNEHSYLLAKDSDNRIYAAVYRHGIFYYNDSDEQFKLLENIPAYSFKQIFFDADNNLWLNTNEGIYKAVVKRNGAQAPEIETIQVLKEVSEAEILAYDKPENMLWLQKRNNEIYSYNISREDLINKTPSFLKSVPSIKNVWFAGKEQLWATDKGIFIVDYRARCAEKLLESTDVLSVIRGTQNLIWAGTDNKGVYRISSSQEAFHTYSSKNLPGFGSNAVRAFYEDEKRALWVGTKGDGLYKISGETPKITRYGLSHGLLNNSVFTLKKGTGDEFWIGTDGNGINYMKINDEKLRKLEWSENMKEKMRLASIYTILPVDDSTLWVGTSGYGMYRLYIDKSTDPFTIVGFEQFAFEPGNKNSLSNNIIYAIIKNDDNSLWIATRGGGLNLFDYRSKTFKHFRHSASDPGSVSDDDILCLHKDRQGVLWVGTSMGFNKMSEYGRFEHITEKDGLPNNTIHGILEDRQRNIWVSTNNGLAKIIKEDNGNYRILSYYQKDGLQNNEFSDGACYYSNLSGLFYFGGISGYNMFDPLEITHDSYMPELYLDAFYIDNKEKKLKNIISPDSDIPKLTLSYDNKSVQFNFASLDYLYSSKCELSYILEGYHKDWIQLGASSSIVLTNIPAGKYLLKIRGSNADKLWSEQCYKLSIEVLPPWWRSRGAYIFYVFFAFLLLSIIIKFIDYRAKIKRDMERKELEKQKTEEIHQAKLSFFTNIAHEFSNSLTLIYGPCEQLLRGQSQDDYTNRYIRIIKSNSERMQNLIMQLIEFRKAETGHLTMKPEIIDVTELIKLVAESFMEILEQKKINFHIERSDTPLYWGTDSNSFEKIVFNLLSNAVKYTPDEQNITISIAPVGTHIQLKVHNTGVGIAAEHQNTIFNKYEVLEQFERGMSKGGHKRSGIGLALCQSITHALSGNIKFESDGSSYATFIVELPALSIDDGQNQTGSVTLDHFVSPPDIYKTAGIKDDPDEDSDKTGTILIVDDDSEIRMLLADILKNSYKTIEVSNGKEAIEAMNLEIPILIITDLIMPEMDGVELVKYIKTHDLTRHIPVIILSSKGSTENHIEGLEIGADAYLNKPFHPKHLEALINNLFQRNKAVLQYGDSHYAAVEQYKGKLINKEDKALIGQITKIIMENIENESLSIDLLANETAQSKMQLYRKIKELTGFTPTEYIRSMRLVRAEKLLKTTNDTVLEIMYSCGFNNKAYFYREFFKQHQITPREYRQKHQ